MSPAVNWLPVSQTSEMNWFYAVYSPVGAQERGICGGAPQMPPSSLRSFTLPAPHWQKKHITWQISDLMWEVNSCPREALSFKGNQTFRMGWGCVNSPPSQA